MASSTMPRSMSGSMASSSTEMTPKFFALVSVVFVGRLGKFQSVICSSVTAMRSKWMSASGANSINVSSIFSPAFTPDGSKSPRWGLHLGVAGLRLLHDAADGGLIEDLPHRHRLHF